MLFVLEIWGWIGLIIMMIILSFYAGKIVIIAGFVFCKLIGHICGPIIETLRKNVHLNAPRLKTHRKKKLELYEDYSRFR